MQGRTAKSIRNIIFAVSGQLLGTVASLVSRSVFLIYLDDTYLGLSTLFASILTILSIVELGVGPALSYSLYKPLAENDKEKIKSLMAFYKKAYRVIGATILVLGLAMLPFYRSLLKAEDIPNIQNLDLIFYLYVLNTGISYFYSYKKSLIICDQNQYITTIYRYGFFILLQIVQIGILAITGNFVIFLVAQIVFTWLENFVVSLRADKLYPYLKEKNVAPIDKGEFSGIKRNIGAMVIHKVVGAGVTSLPSILISKLINIVTVGIYSNYLLITNALQNVLAKLFEAILAGVGNLNATKDYKRLTLVHNCMFLLNFWIYGFFSIALMCMFNPFISVWIGSDYLFDRGTVFVIVLNFYIYGMRRTLFTFKDATGTFGNDRYRPIAELVINLGASTLLGMKFGLIGILGGNIISTIATAWVEPLVVYRHVLHEKLWKFFARYGIYTAIGVAAYFLTDLVLLKPETVTVSSVVINILICCAVPNVIFLLSFMFTPEFKYCAGFVFRKKNR